jgi:hypothetical protein
MLEARENNAIRIFVLVFGVIYALIGVMGFIPALVQTPAANAPSLTVTSQYGYLLGLFPVNLVHNIIHLAVGLLGIIAYSSLGAARTYSRAMAVVFAVLTVMGLFPTLQTTFGLAPLFSNDVWLHALTAVVTGIFGFVLPATTEDRELA